MFSIVLVAPEIPPNTGNIIRLCANTGCQLHLVEPLGFALGDKQLRRAGLDYHEFASVEVWPDWRAFEAGCKARLVSFSTRHSHLYSDFQYQPGDCLVFGSETRGLPADVADAVPSECRLHIPMLPASRSLNLSNSVAVVVYEAWRQYGFSGRP